MALPATGVWETRTTGSDTACSGGFNPGNANMATDLAATSATGNSPVVTSASYTFVAGDVGAWLYVSAGTNWRTGWYQIASVATGAATLTASIGSALSPAYVLNTVAGCATVASPTAGTWSVDYSQQSSAKFAYTDMVIDGAVNTRFTSAANPIGKNCVGNFVSVTSGTGFTVQTVEIVSTSTITATCDKSLGTLASTGGNGYLGGALASIGRIVNASGSAAGTPSIGMQMWITGSYNVGNGTVNTSGNAASWTTGSIVGFRGYGTFRGDGGRATLTCTGTATTIISGSSNDNFAIIENLILDGAGLATTRGINGNAGSLRVYNCKGSNFTNNAFSGSPGTMFENCEATGCATQPAFNVSNAYACVAHDNTVTGFGGASSSTATLSHCLSYNNTGGSSAGFNFADFRIGGIKFCTAYGNGGAGFTITPRQVFLINCIAYGNTGVGIIMGSSRPASVSNCATGNNTGGATTIGVLTASYNLVSLSADPFTNAAGGDFSLNNTAGGGAAVKAAGIPGAFPGLATTTSYPDIGAVQSRGGAAASYGFVG